MKKILLLFVALLATTTVWAENYITNVMVIGGSKSVVNNLKDTYTSQGWEVINQDLNAGCGSSSDYIYLLYKSASNENTDVGFITGFYISDANGTAPDNITHDGRTYTLVDYNGSDFFKNNKGDLNSHCGSSSATIHLYYTNDNDEYYSSTAVNSISFDANQSGAVGVNGGTTGYDLNASAGGDYIYMHVGTGNKGWTISMNSNHTQCTITGYQGTKNNKTIVYIPNYIDGASVTGFSGSVFSGFTNLETMFFYETTQVIQMASMQGCSKFKNIKTGSTNNKTPASMTSIPASAFVGTDLRNLTLTSVTNVGANAFAGSTVLNSVEFKKSPVTIGDGAFSYIVREGSNKCQVTYPGSIDAWSPSKYMYSPSLVVNGGSGSNTWSCGWCGGSSSSSYNRLYWTLDAAGQLKIDCADNNWSNHPSEQVIVYKGWTKNLVKSLTLEHVYSLGVMEFTNHANLKNVYINPTLHSIDSNAFLGCSSLTDIWFSGSQAQWEAVDKGGNWNPSAATEHWRCTVTFNANGHGTDPASQTIWSNNDKATVPTAPTANGYTFQGWYTEAACINQWDFNTVVTGDMTLYAKWGLAQYTFNSETGELTLNWGEFNKDNKWGNEVPASAVKSVTATSQVSFTGDCSNLFAEFYNCTSMDLNSVNTSAVINMKRMFFNCGALSTLNISNWDTGNVTNMSWMFSICGTSALQLDISGWDTGKVTDMSDMFYLYNGSSLDLSGWDTGNVTDMSYMFQAYNGSSLDISGWNTSKVRDMTYMFNACTSLKMLNITGWDISNVVGLTAMFSSCAQLTTIYASTSWDAGDIEYSDYMFNYCSKLVGGMGTTFDSNHIEKEYARIDRGTDEPGYFTGVFTLTLPVDVTASVTPVFTIDDIAYYTAGTTVTLTYNGNVPEGQEVVYSVNGTAIEGNTFEMPLNDATVTVELQELRYTYDSATGALTLLRGEFNKDNKWGNDVDEENVTSVTATSEVSFTGDCSELFYNFESCESMDLSNVNTSAMTSACDMFFQCEALTSLNISNWDIGNVTDMAGMFYYCSSMTSFDISGWNTANVTNMEGMFSNCDSLTSLDLSNWNTSKVTNLGYMFRWCGSLTSLNISSWNTSTATNMGYMFLECTGLTTLDISGWDTGNVTSMTSMFAGCTNLTTIVVGMGWSTEKVTMSGYMFDDCTSLVGGMGTTYDQYHTNKAYAHIDGGSANPGYLTANIPRYTYDSTTGALSLNWGVFNKDDMWGSEVIANNVTSVTATNQVNFMGDCSELFKGFTNCTSMDLSSVNTSSVTSMISMFENCSSLTSLDLSNWNTGNLSNMNSMFNSCTSLKSLDVSNFNTMQVYTMMSMFNKCSSLKTLDISGWDTRNLTNPGAMFQDCSKLKTIYAGGGWTTQWVYGSCDMFTGCTSLVGGMGTTYNASHTGKEYAHIDGGPDNPGYFTDPNAVVVVIGDVDGDGAVTTVDVTCIYNYLLNGDTTFIDTCDVDGDGIITTTDITVIYNILLGN